MKKRILFVVSSARHIGPNNRVTGNLLTETAAPYVTFTQKGYEVDIYSVNGGEAPLDGMELYEDYLNQIFLNGDGLTKMKHTTPIDELKSVDCYDAVFTPGGLAPMVDLADNKKMHEIHRTMWETGRVVSAVCHGPVCLLNVKLSNGSWLISGKHITAYTNAEEETYAWSDVPFQLEDALKAHGCNFTSVAPLEPYSITDGRLVTGQNPKSALGVAVRVVTILESDN